MTTESEIKLARYSESATEADKFGRLITVRRLRPSEQGKITGFTSELHSYDEMTNAAGDKVQIPHRMPYIIAAAVRQIDESPIPFPRSRGELDAIYDRLDMEGLEAAGKAFVKLAGGVDTDPQEEAKNLSGTLSSA